MAVSHSKALEQLYAADPDRFVAERKRLAGELRKAGKDAEAADVAARRKPSLPVFFANRLARSRPNEVAALIEAAAKMARAQQAGEAAEVRTHGSALNDQVRELVDAASISWRGLSADAARRLASTLRAAATVPSFAEDLRRGVLQSEVEPAGFGLFTGMEIRPAKKPPRTGDRGAKQRERKAKLAHTKELKGLEASLGQARSELRAAETAARAAEREATRSRRRVSDLEARLKAARA